MGSLDLEDEKLVQMIHDFIELETPPINNNPCFPPIISSNYCLSSTKTHHFNLMEILRNGSKKEEEEVIESVVLKHLSRGNKKSSSDEHEEDEEQIMKKNNNKKKIIMMKWLVMKLKIDGYFASLCQSSWPTSMGCPAGKHEYIEIKMKKMRLIVDIDLKSEFEVARPTQSYKQLIQTLPKIFVGNEEKLFRIISILCSAAKQSLKENGLHLPPWRTIAYMQCKWMMIKTKHHHHHKNGDQEQEDEEEEEDDEEQSFKINWIPPMVMMKQKRRPFNGGSALSTQFSNMSINCC